MDALDEQLGRVGNNLNQMAHGANISRELPAARRLEEALAEHRALTRADADRSATGALVARAAAAAGVGAGGRARRGV